jgi:hypothetical protein
MEQGPGDHEVIVISRRVVRGDWGGSSFEMRRVSPGVRCPPPAPLTDTAQMFVGNVRGDF